MIDLNHILLFIACVSPLVLLAQAWRRGGLNRGWRLAACAVLIVTALAWTFARESAGFIGGGAWLVLLLLPAIAFRKIAEMVVQGRFAPARKLLLALRFVHPAGGLLEEAHILRALDLAQKGHIPAALKLLAPLRNDRTAAGRHAIAQSFRLTGDWDGLREWLKQRAPESAGQDEMALLPLYLRALGEAGLTDDLVREFRSCIANQTATPQNAAIHDACLLVLLAFCGRIKSVAQLLQTRLKKLPASAKEFWIATTELAAGETSTAYARFERLRASTDDGLIQADIAQRFNRAAGGRMPPSAVSQALLQHIEKTELAGARAFAPLARPTVVVAILLALNLTVFGAELMLGGSMNPSTLHRLGALELSAVWVRGEYWRLFTALFLHYGPLHLLFNLYALFVIGPGLERALGWLRFGVCYLLSGLGSGFGVLLLGLFRLTGAEQLVGASGCVMGLVGAWAGLLLRHRHAPLAGRRLRNILLIVVVQTAFDLSTPQISMAAHLSGLLTGTILGLIFAPRHFRG